MRKSQKTPGITLRDVVNHISGLKQDFALRFTNLEHRIGRLEGRMHTMEHAMVHLQNSVNTLDTKVSNVDARLDVIEIAIVEQRHEKRIRRIERQMALST